MNMKNKYILVHGPTGVGKSATIEQIGATLPIEIVNCDVGQFYTPFSIGTAKPDWRSSTIAHHLFDVIDTPENFSVVKYRELITQKMSEIRNRGNVPVLVGGSGFYGKSLFFPPLQDSSDSNVSDKASWDKLYELDPERAKTLHKNDTYRIARACAIMQSTGNLPSKLTPHYDPLPGDCLVIFLTRNRDELYSRINSRTYQMLTEGWIEEVMKLRGTEWESFLERKKLIGYTDILQYLKVDIHDEDSKDRLIEIIQRRTRNYAKRQETFWKMFKRLLEPHFEKNASMIAEVNLSDTLQKDFVKKYLMQFLSQ